MRVWSAERIFVKGRFERDWALMVDDAGLIQAIGPRAQLVSKASQVMHYPQSLILPAFVNPHHHGFHSVFKGIADQTVSYDELLSRLVWPLSQAIDEELLEALYRIAFAEQAISGVAAVGEFHYLHNGGAENPREAKFAEKIIELALEVGLRISLVYGLFDQGDSGRTQAFIEPLDQSLRNYKSLVDRYRDNPKVRIIPGIHGLMNTSAEAIIAAYDLAKKTDTRLHIQLAERSQELEESNVQYGASPLRALDKMGVLDERLVFINGNHLDASEFKLAKERGVSAIVCPSAIAARGGQLSGIGGLLKNEIPFSIGSDSVCMSNAFSPPDEIKWIEYTQRQAQKKGNILHRQAKVDWLWDLATVEAARMIDLEQGRLMPGTPADFMMVDLDRTSFRPRWNFMPEAFINQIVFGWGPQVQLSHVVVGGQSVVENGRVLNPKLRDSYHVVEQWGRAFVRSLENSTKTVSMDETESETTSETTLS